MVNIKRDLSSEEPGKRKGDPGRLSAEITLAPGLAHHPPTFHEDHQDVQELPEGQVAIAIFVGQREHGLHKHVLGFEAQGLGKLSPTQLTCQGLSYFLWRVQGQSPCISLVNVQHLYPGIRRGKEGRK